MAGSFSIFLKICPGCAGNVPTASDRCGCGHVFEAAGPDGLAPEEQALCDEELYERYLLARLEQAHESVREAQFALEADPRNPIKIKAAELTREAAHSMELNHAGQRARVEALRRTIEAARAARVPDPSPAASAAPVPPTPPRKPEPGTSPAPAIARMSEPERRPAAPVRPKTDAAISAPPAAPPAPPAAASPLPAPTARASSNSPAPSGIVSPVPGLRVAQLLGAIREIRARQVSARSGGTRTPPDAPAPQPLAPPVASTLAPAVEISAHPPRPVRREQAERAGQVLARKLKADPENCPGWDCPNCTARVPANTARCACGYAFHAGDTELPSLSLGGGERPAAGRYGVNKRTRD